MGRGSQLTEPGRQADGVYTWEEVQRHCNRNDQWLVINRKVYNITQWAKRHPGGFRVIGHYAGEDATVMFLNDQAYRPIFNIFLECAHISHNFMTIDRGSE